MFEKIVYFVLFLVIAVVFIFLAAPIPVLAAYNTTDIDINISELSQITLMPTYLNWTQIITGTTGGHKNITVKNIGSVNVSQIYAYVNTLLNETTRPYGSSDASKYSAGGVLTIRNETDAKYYYLGKLEWNWTEDIPTHDWSDLTNITSWGYFRNLTDSYVWAIGGTNGTCNNTLVQLALENDKDTGVSETRYPRTSNITNNGADANWSYFSVVGEPLYGYCIAVYKDCQKIYIYNFDERTSPNFQTCTEADHLYYGNLTPGDTIILKVDPWVPWGTPAGNLTQTTLTVVGS